MPSDKIVIGKPLHKGGILVDGNNYVEPNVIYNVLLNSESLLGGVMGWKLLNSKSPNPNEQRMATFNFFDISLNGS